MKDHNCSTDNEKTELCKTDSIQSESAPIDTADSRPAGSEPREASRRAASGDLTTAFINLAVAILVLVGAILALNSQITPSESAKPRIVPSYPARIQRVINGTTIDAVIDLGFEKQHVARGLRLHGVYIERDHARAHHWLTRMLGTGQVVVTFVDNSDNEVILWLDGENINDSLVAEGIASHVE